MSLENIHERGEAEPARLVQRWLASDDAHATARRLAQRRGLPIEPNELVHDAWVRIEQGIQSNTHNFEDVFDARSAARYGARTIDNLSRDRLRAAQRRREFSLDVIEIVGPADGAADATNGEYRSSSDQRLVVEDLLESVIERAGEGTRCRGCPVDVVVATAITLIHMVLNDEPGAERGRQWIDQMLYAALERSNPSATIVGAAGEQRKSRCGRCVMALLRDAISATSEEAK